MALESLRGQRVLVTGANGFAGTHLVRALLREGAVVRAFVRRPDAVAPDVRPRVEVAAGDVRDARAVDAAVAGCDRVFHVAGMFRDASGRDHEYWDTNVTGTEHVLAACEAHRVARLVHTSTMGVHGSVSAVPSDETAPFNPSDAYQRSKVAGEERVWAWYRRTQIPTTVVRPAAMYGPGDLRFLKLFRSIQSGVFVMLGRGETRLHNVYVEDLMRGFLLCGTHDAAIGEPFLIAGPRHVTLNEFVALVAETLHAPRPRWSAPVWPVYAAGALCEAVCVPLRINPPLHRRRVGFFTHNRAFTSAKAQRLLGYAPQVDLPEGLRLTLEWYVAQGHVRPVNGRPAGRSA